TTRSVGTRISGVSALFSRSALSPGPVIHEESSTSKQTVHCAGTIPCRCSQIAVGRGCSLAQAYSLNTEGNGMGIIGTIFIGLIVGLLARFLKPGDDSMGWIMTIVLGIAGSLAATYGGQALGIYQAGEGAGFLGALVGAIILLVIYGMIKKK
ncbi:Transglycosylase, partial [Pseudomonas amygdali pv. mori]